MFQLKGHPAGEFPPLGEGQPFVVFKSSTDETRPTHVERAIRFTQSTNSNVDSYKNDPSKKAPRITFDQYLGTPSPAMLTRKIHHHRGDEKVLDKNSGDGHTPGTYLTPLNDTHTGNSTVKIVLNIFYHNI